VGADSATVTAPASAEPAGQALRERSAQVQARGIFGAPMFFVGDEMFWGNVRLEDAIALAVCSAGAQ
jgi:2-hydroxychromene-2-carboxylate isomerase